MEALSKYRLFNGRFIALVLSLTYSLVVSLSLPATARNNSSDAIFNWQKLFAKKVQPKYKSVSRNLAKHLPPAPKQSSLTGGTPGAGSGGGVVSPIPKVDLKQSIWRFKFGNAYNIKQFGAYGDGVHDDQNAIDQALGLAKGSGMGVYFPAGNYLHSGPIVANGVPIAGAGASTVFTASNPYNGAVQLTGMGTGLSNVVIQYANTAAIPRNWPDQNPYADGLLIYGANGFDVNHVTLVNCSNYGVWIEQSTNGSISNIAVLASQNDSLMVTDCSYLQILYNSFAGAVAGAPLTVQPNDHGGTNTGFNNVLIAYNTFQTSVNNCTCVLASFQDCAISYNNFISTSTSGAAPYCAMRLMGGGNNLPTNNFQMTGNVISGYWHVGISTWIWDPTYSDANISNVLISQNSVTGALDRAISLENGQNLFALANTVNGGNSTSLGIYCNTAQNVQILNNNVQNTASSAIQLAVNNGTGSVQVASNSLASSCTGSTGSVLLASTPTGTGHYNALSIVNNSYAGPVNHATYFINCLVPSAGIARTINGNTSAVLLPNNIVP